MLEWLRRRIIGSETESHSEETKSPSLETASRLAEDALIRGDFEQASIAYKSITNMWPNLAFAYSRRGRALLQLGHRIEAAHEFDRALQLDPGDPESLYNKGLIAQELGQEIEAFQSFERAFATTVPHPEAGLKLADASLARGSPSMALDLYQRVLDIDPTIAEAHYGYGEAAALLGRETDALKAFAHALSIKPGFAAAALKLADASLARGSPSVALDLYQRVLDIDPTIAEAHYGYGEAAALLGRETDAMDAFGRALSIKPGFAAAALKLADASLARGSPASALDLYQRVFDIDPNIAEAHFGYGEAAMLFGRHADAIEAFRRALILKPDFAEGHFGYGEAAMLLGRDADAIAAFRRALIVKPDFAAAKAVAIFQQLFPIPSTRRPRASRPLICIPIIPTYYRDWFGGQSYLVNFVRIMSTLQRAQRPRIVVIMFCDNERDIAKLRSMFESMAESDVVIGVVNAKAELIYSRPIFDRMIRRRNKIKMPRRHVVQELMSTVDWTFPVLYPLWRVPEISGPLFWIPDLQHRILPSFFHAEEIAGRDRDMKALALRSVPIIFSSRTAQQHFNEHFPTQYCRTSVWHFVSKPDIASAQAREHYQALRLPARFYYTPNQFWRHKDHVTLFHALRRILDRGHHVTFVCTGSELDAATDEYFRELLALVESLSLGQNLRLLGVLPRGDQLEVMRSCCAVIQPSLFEGWSTVIEDARAIGRPVIASDIPVHREQLGESAAFFAPGSVESLAAAVISLDHKLKPGPDPEQEAAALLDLQSRMQRSAQDFLAILQREAVARLTSELPERKGVWSKA